MHNKRISSILGVLVLTALLSLPVASALAAEAENTAGSVKSFTGVAQVIRLGAAPLALKPGDRIFEKDVLTTGKDSSLGLIMRDNSVVSMGPESRLVVERFLFAPEKSALASVLRLNKGSLACVTGEITKLSPESVKVMASGYSIGVRGTHFLVNVDEASEAKEGR